MKKAHSLLVIFLITSVFSITGFCQSDFRSCTYINKYWGKWKNSDGYMTGKGDSNDSFIIYEHYSHPSAYIMKVTIYNMVIEKNRKELKRRVKSNQWYEFNGTVEYFTNPSTDINKQIIYWPSIVSPNATEPNVKSVVSAARIKVAPDKKDPNTLNIYFEDVGIAIKFRPNTENWLAKTYKTIMNF